MHGPCTMIDSRTCRAGARGMDVSADQPRVVVDAGVTIRVGVTGAVTVTVTVTARGELRSKMLEITQIFSIQSMELGVELAFHDFSSNGHLCVQTHEF